MRNACLHLLLLLLSLCVVSSYVLPSPQRRRTLTISMVAPRSTRAVAHDVLKTIITTTKAAAATAAVVAALPLVSSAADNSDEATKPKKAKKVKVLETDLGIPYIVVKKGSGNYPNPGDFVVITYTGFLSDGTVFDSTEGKGKKAKAFRFGQKQVIPGIESVVELMQPGGEVTCSIPSKYAYGTKGVCVDTKEGKKECLVKPNEDLKYVIKLKTVGAGYN